MGLINQTNKIFTDAPFNLDLSLNLRHDLVVQVYENSLLYNYMYNRMICSSIHKSDIVRKTKLKYNAFPTYNIGNMNKYVTCKGKIKKQDCPCPKCVESRTGETLWMCDSGASDHFTYNIDDFSKYEPFQEGQMCWVKTADSISPLKGQGTVIIKHQLKNGKSHLVKLYPVLHIYAICNCTFDIKW